MTEFELGLGIQSDKQPGEYAVLASAAEAHGVDVLSVYGDLMYQPPIGPLLEMAHVTSRVRLGPACLNPYSLHPHEIAGQIASLDLASRGRAYLGLARGAWLDGVGIRQSRPLRRLEEAAAVVAMLLGGDATGFEGDVFRMAPGTRLAYRPYRSEVPLLIGAWGPRTLALAGRIASEVKVGGSANPEIVPVVRDRLGAAGADVRIVVGAVSVVDDDGRRARARARTEVAMYLDVIGPLDPTIEIPADVMTHVRRHLAAGDAVEAGRLIPDEVLDRFAFAGTPDQVAEQVTSLRAAGADRVELGTPHGLDAKRGIDLIGRYVVPAVAEG